MASPFLRASRGERRNRGGEQRTEGVTLLECAVAMAVAAIAFSGVFSALVFFGSYQEETALAVKAALCAQERIEELRYEVETGAAASQDSHVVLLEGPYEGMERLWTAVPVSGQPGLWRLESECAFSWKGERKGERFVCLAASRGS